MFLIFHVFQFSCHIPTWRVAKLKVWQENKDIRRDISENISQEAVDAKILKLINAIGENWYPLYKLMENMGFASRPMFVKNYLNPAITLGLIKLEKPESPKAPNQRYGLTDKGKSLYYQK